VTHCGPKPTAVGRQQSARSRHSGTGWIEPLPLLDPLVQPEPDFQFDQAVGCDATPVPTVKPLQQLCQLAPGELFMGTNTGRSLSKAQETAMITMTPP
jgi:hypothetical protein